MIHNPLADPSVGERDRRRVGQSSVPGSQPTGHDPDGPDAPRKAAFCLTLDTELVWGSIARMTPSTFESRYPDVRGTIRAILDLLEKYDVRATWAVVGHLFLDRCERTADGTIHPELVHPTTRVRGLTWYEHDPGSDRARDPLWYGADVVDGILAARPTHEIASHSFGHVPFDDPGMTPDVVRADLAACVALAAARGIELRSFVFPRNREAHHELVRDAGFVAYRGDDLWWHRRLPGPLRRAGHVLDQALGLPPPVGRPHAQLPELVSVPGSMLLMAPGGVRRAVSLRARVLKARWGIRRAVATGGVFHLWTHPYNIAARSPYMLRVLEAILSEVAEARDRGELDIETVAEAATRAQPARPDEMTRSS